MESDVPRYADIAVDASLGPNRTLTYLVPPHLSITSGQLVYIPLASRMLSGIVFGITTTTDIIGVRPIIGVHEITPILSDCQLELARWISHNTASSLFESAALMLPLDFKNRIATLVRLTEKGKSLDEAALPVHVRRLITALKQQHSIPRNRINKIPGLGKFIRHGYADLDWEWKDPKARPHFIEYLCLTLPDKETTEHLNTMAKQALKQKELLNVLLSESDNIGMELSLLRKTFSRTTISSLINKNLATIKTKQEIRDPLQNLQVKQEQSLILTQAQLEAINVITNPLRQRNHSETFLLEGVTGSGKTEVYLHVLAHYVALGFQGLFLVPEISLTPQLITRLANWFPDKVGVLHSGLTPGQQYDTWWRINRGDFDVILGSRSAIFAPQRNLGIIIIDEEHEWTYKQHDTNPRYDARSVATELARLTNSTVLLGGATPDISTYSRALRKEITHLRLPHRIAPNSRKTPINIKLPSVEIVDMRDELKDGIRSIFSRSLQTAIASTLRKNEQVLLFVNRRGSAGIVQCRQCGHVLRCKRCEAGLTYHEETNRVTCHLCGRSLKAPGNCPNCLSKRIRYLGLGTQRVVSELKTQFNTKILRWDRDTVHNATFHQKFLEEINQGNPQIIVGTQMIAKGLHLPNVTLVGVILADLGLYLPDFRASERSFQLLCQVIGRAGRGLTPGHAIIQTYSPQNYAIRAAAQQNYEMFYHQEMNTRESLVYPPFSRLARLIFQHSNEEYTRMIVHRHRKLIEKAKATLGVNEVTVIGPIPAYPPKVNGRFRWQMILKAPGTSASLLPDLVNSLPKTQGWSFDIDPVNLA